MSTTVYLIISSGVAVALRGGNTSHIAQHIAALAAAISNQPIPALTASKRNRLTGRERVKSVDPCRPLVAWNEGCVAIPAPESIMENAATAMVIMIATPRIGLPTDGPSGALMAWIAMQ